jgi:hypothetical protein
LTILSGVSRATFSISTPPSVEATMTGPRGGAVEQDREVVFLLDALAWVK